MAKREKAEKTSALIRIMKAPIRALRRARDNYVSSIPGCAGHRDYGAARYPLDRGAAALPRSFSLQPRQNRYTTGQDLRVLVRAASQNATGSLNKIENPPTVKRSRSVAISRIDEDKPCEFDPVLAPSFIYPRSSSVRVHAKRIGVIG